MKHSDAKQKITACFTRLEVIRSMISTSDPNKITLLKFEAEIVYKELSAIRLMQGYDRIFNTLKISIISALGGGGLLVAFFKYFGFFKG